MSATRLLLLPFALIGLAASADAGPRERDRDQHKAWREAREGNFIPLHVIERQAVRQMPGADYLGSEMNGSQYRLKFMREGRVLWLDVDARTGRVVGRSGF